MSGVKKNSFYIITISLIIILCLALLEGTYFVYKRYIKKQDMPHEINLSATTLFQRDKEIGCILKPNASTTFIKDWKDRKDEYDKQWHGLNKRISTNAAGYRGPMYPIQKPDNALRILVLGGSTTWGCFNNDGETWPAYLENIMQDKIKDKRIEVINAAVGGYTTAQNLALFKRKFQYYKPDIVLIACWFNDMYYNDPLFPSPDADNDVNKRMSEFFGKKFIYPFPAGRILFDKISLLIKRLKPEHRFSKEYTAKLKNPDKQFFRKYYSNEKIWIRNYFKNVDEIMKLANKQNSKTKFFIIAMPYLFAPGSPDDFLYNFSLPDYNINLYHRSYLCGNQDSRLLFLSLYYHTALFQDLILEKRKDCDYELILGYGALGRRPLEERVGDLFYDEMHLTARGNQLLAHEIADCLTD